MKFFFDYSPLDEREKNQDIFSMTLHNSILYYGGRDHYVRRVNLNKNMETLPAFEEPHHDAITTMTICKDYLISG